jgi:hypothetical protein
MSANIAARNRFLCSLMMIVVSGVLGFPAFVVGQVAATPDRGRSEAAALVTGPSSRLQSVIAGTPPTATLMINPVPAKTGSYPALIGGGPNIVGNELRLDSGGVRVWVEGQVVDWDPNSDGNPPVIGAQIYFDGSGLLDADTDGDGLTSDDGDQEDIAYATVACNSDAPCEAAFGEVAAFCEMPGNMCRPNYGDKNAGVRPDSWCEPAGCLQAAGGGFTPVSWVWFAQYQSPGPRPDDGIVRWIVTAVYDVPPGAKGRYMGKIGTEDSFIYDNTVPPNLIPTVSETGFVINVITGLCCYGLGSPSEACVDGVTRAECDANPAPRSFLQEQNCLNTCKMCNGNPPCLDGDLCTADACTGAGSCSYTSKAGWNPGSSCCNSSDGSIDPLGSVSPCMVPSCSQPNGRGELVLTPVAEGAPCSLQDPCFANEACDAFGNCVGDYLPGEGCWKNRFLPLLAADSGDVSALRVRLTELQNPQPPNAGCCPPPDFSAYEYGASCTDPGDCERWVGPVVDVYEHQNALGLGGHRMARLQCAPYYTHWIQEGPFYIAGAEIVPSSLYDLDQLGASCMGNEDTCLDIIASFSLATTRHGDVAAPFDPPSGGTQPDGVDVTSLVNHFRHVSGAPRKPAAQLQPNLPELNTNMNALDIVAGVDAFRGLAYAFSGPCPCPSTVVCNAMPCASAAQCGSGQTCVRTCAGGSAAGAPCLTDLHCPGGACGAGACRDRCGRCN